MSLVVAITGASAGIGRATAIRLARDGAALAICARRPDRLDETAAAVRQAGGTALAVVADVTRDADMRAFVDATTTRFGRLDAMICNAGYGIYGSIDQIPPEEMQRVMEVNYLGTYQAARAAMAAFRQQQRGHLLIVSSVVGKRGIPYMSAYAATKFAQVGLAECMRAELRGTGIDVSVVFPISTETEFFEVMTKRSGFATRAGGPRQSAADVAEAIARGLRHPIPEIYPFRGARGLVLLNAIAPGLTDRIVKRWGRKPIAAAG
jgi:short-subunit dehydrogenase